MQSITEQMVNFGKNSNDNYLTLLKKAVAIMLFPQSILDQVKIAPKNANGGSEPGEPVFPKDMIQRLIHIQFKNILPFMGPELI